MSEFETKKIKTKNDCFAYDVYARSCKALNELYCMFDECPFYKTKKERCEGCKKAWGRQLTCEECVNMGLK